MSDRPVMVLGATSSIARAIAEGLARDGHSLYLAGRDLPELWKVASDIQIKHGVEVNVGVFDADDPAQHQAFIENAISRTKGLGGAVVAFGQLGDHAETEKNPQLAQATIVRNYSAAVSILLLIANHLEESRTGFIVAISSVAGDRGRYSNYVYGSAKAGLSAFLSGLRSRMQKVGVPVLTVKPGFVDTAMTFGREGMRKVASPEAVGKAVVRAIKKRKDVVYVPGMWRWIMLVIKLVPERVFKKLKF
jgi:decaprenylphospho-beta-D-erythro-pentofuranosid-2-ulose 2-reductase